MGYSRPRKVSRFGTNLLPGFKRGTLVYDITDEDSFQKVKNWVKELKKMLGSEIVLMIVGNKLDLEQDRNVSVEEAESYAAQVGAKHFQTSAKLNEGIEELFSSLTREMLNHATQLQKSRPHRGPERVQQDEQMWSS
ncbi:ras-related protein Rab-21-like [Ctenocephalides felis]|uniref:ras-related protein Rab-21-like n=1 Tax=Ctenocephalides felis TaxID=7515 RepID=UPI000E6E4803|nr:ras-related protein Rab-21-like [Ctenocephalides felis]